MAVITRYVVVRNGVELDKIFTDKKEALAYDNMLDAADALETFIKTNASEIDIDDATIREISVVLAKNGPEVTKILKNVKPPAPPRPAAEPKSEKQPPEKVDTGKNETAKPKRKK